MSHCTSFPFAYCNETMIFDTARDMGLTTSTDAVLFYRTNLHKLADVSGGLTHGHQERSLVLTDGHINAFMVQVDGAYQMILESGTINEEIEAEMAEFEQEFRFRYALKSVESLAESMRKSGVGTQIEATEDTILLRFGPSLERSVRVTLSPDGLVEEEVSGVEGQSCTDLTERLEAMMAAATVELATVWKPEYSTVVRDRVVQVLKLGQ